MNTQNSQTATPKPPGHVINCPAFYDHTDSRFKLIGYIADFEGELMRLGAQQRLGLEEKPFKNWTYAANLAALNIRNLKRIGGISSEFVYELVMSVIKLAAQQLPAEAAQFSHIKLPPIDKCLRQSQRLRNKFEAVGKKKCSTFEIIIQGVASYESRERGQYEITEYRSLGKREGLPEALELFRSALDTGNWSGEKQHDEDYCVSGFFVDKWLMGFKPEYLIVRDGYFRQVHLGSLDGKIDFPDLVSNAWRHNATVAKVLTSFHMATATTQNSQTATTETTRTWCEQINTLNLPPRLAEEMRFLASLCDKEERMLQSDRYALIDGSGHNIANMVCCSVTDWSVPRPKIPAAVVSAWLLARKMVKAAFEEAGEAEWHSIEKCLKAELIAGYHHR